MAWQQFQYPIVSKGRGRGGVGAGGGQDRVYLALGELTFACVAWEGRRGNCGVSEVRRNMLEMWGTVALCQWLVMLQQLQVTCTWAWTDKPQQCCFCRYCALHEEGGRFALMLCCLLHAATRPNCVLADRQTMSSGSDTGDLLRCVITTFSDVRDAEDRTVQMHAM